MPTVGYDALKRSFCDGGLPEDLVSALLEEYEENKRRYFLHDYRPAAINGGRFCEAVVRVVQYLGAHPHVPLGGELKVDRALTQIENDTTLEEGLRLHVPRAIRLIYGVRNKRDAGHLKGGLDTSFQDATLVVSTLDWILAEVVRMAHGVSATEAQALISDIVSKEVPLVAVFDGRPVLMADLSHVDHVLVILYWAGEGAVARSKLRGWLPPNVAKNVTRPLAAAKALHYVHLDGDQVYLTPKGQRYVEEAGLLRPL